LQRLRPAIFLDRDGTVTEEIGYVSTAELHRFRFEKGVPEALRSLSAAGYRLVVVTNQSGVARGIFPASEVDAVHARLREMLADHGVALDGIYYCPHHPDPKAVRVPHLLGTCDCRKPLPGMGLRAARELGIDLRRSWMIGDLPCDLRFAERLGCGSALVLTGHGRRTLAELHAEGGAAPLICANLADAAQRILSLGDEAFAVPAARLAPLPAA